MKRSKLPLAISDSFEIVWASQANHHETYECACCGAHLQLHHDGFAFIHPPVSNCHPARHQAKLALLYLESILSKPDSWTQLLVRCIGCDNFELVNIRGPCELLRKGEVEGIFVDSFERILLVMRPADTSARTLAGTAAARCLEIDARTALSGGPIVALRGRLHTVRCSQCQTKTEKLGNP